MIYLISIGWAVCGFVHYGLYLGFFQTQWPELAEKDLALDRIFAAILAIFGPVALFATLNTCRPFSWKL
jgi:hypothetical protein